MIVRADVTISLLNSRITKATVLDPNGMATGEVTLEKSGGPSQFRFPTEALYVVLQ
jgi:hypothetical protein